MNAIRVYAPTRKLRRGVEGGLVALALLTAFGAQAAPPDHARNPRHAPPDHAAARQNQPLCNSCAVVQSIRTEQRKGKGGIVGLAGGAVVGGLLGNQIGGGTGNTIATIGGAAAGAMAGKEIERRVDKDTVWITQVTMRDGSRRTFEQREEPRWDAGEVVVVDGDRLQRR